MSWSEALHFGQPIEPAGIVVPQNGHFTSRVERGKDGAAEVGLKFGRAFLASFLIQLRIVAAWSL